MTFARLSPGHVIALVAALVLILLLAADWYTTDAGVEARRIESLQQVPPTGSATADSLSEDVERRASAAAEEEERTAWQADSLLDRVILLLVLASAMLAIAAGFLAAAGRADRLTPIAALVSLVGALGLLYRLLEPPGAGGQIQIGLLGALVAIATIAIGSSLALRGSDRLDRV